MTFKDSLHIVTTDFFFKLILPDRAMGLTARMQRTRKAFEELRVSLNSCSSIVVHLCLSFESFIWWRWSKNVSMPRKFSVMIYSAVFWRPMITPLMLPLYQKMSSSVCGLPIFQSSSFIKLYCRQYLHLPRCRSWGSNLRLCHETKLSDIFYPFRRLRTLCALHLLCLRYIQRSKRNSSSTSNLSSLMVKNRWEPIHQSYRRPPMLTRIQTYEQMPLLTYSLAVFYETLRMFPPVSISRI